MNDLVATPAAVTSSVPSGSVLYGNGAYNDGGYDGPAATTVQVGPTDIEGVSVFAVIIQGDPTWTIGNRGVLPDPEAIYGGSQEIAVSALDPIVVVFDPVTPGSYTASLEVAYNGVGGADTLVVALTGTGT